MNDAEGAGVAARFLTDFFCVRGRLGLTAFFHGDI
jgi:hypothetical protein